MVSVMYEMDLCKILIEFGVSKEHLNLMKKELIVVDEFEYYYEWIDGTYVEDVETSKICSVSRHQGDSWFDTLEKVVNEKNADINLEYGRFMSLLGLTEKMNLEEVRSLFSSKEFCRNIYFNHYIEDDKYVQHTDGNHRTILAKLFEVKILKPCEIIKYRKNEGKYKNYIRNKNNYNEIQQFAKLNNLRVYGDFCDSIFKVVDDTHCISFEFNGISRLDSLSMMEDRTEFNRELFIGLKKAVSAKGKFEKVFKRTPLLFLRIFGNLVVKKISNKYERKGVRAALLRYEKIKIEEYIKKRGL